MALQLNVTQEKFGGPILDIRWCLSKNDFRKLEKEDVPMSSIYVLLVICYDNGLEDRELRKLEEVMTKMQVYYPGKHKIFARLVWPTYPTVKAGTQIAEFFLQLKTPHCYEQEVMVKGKEKMLGNFGCGTLSYLTRLKEQDGIFDASEVSIEVEKGHFAPEPRPWMKRWVNRWFKYKQVDQCHFRRRQIFAFTLQPPIMAILFLVLQVRNIFAWFWWGCIFGDRKAKLSLLLHPWRTDWSDFKGGFSVFLQNSQGEDEPWRLAFSPVPYLVVLAITSRNHFGLQLPWFAALTHTLLLLVYIVLAIAGVIGVIFLCDSKPFRKLLKEIMEPREDQERKAKIQEALVCSTVSKLTDPMAYASLPKEVRTVRLWFLNQKAKVCKPFAG